MHGIFSAKLIQYQVSLPASQSISVRYNISLSNQRSSIAISRTFNLNEQVFNKVIVIEVSVTARSHCDLNTPSLLNLSYSFFGDSFTFSAALFYDPIEYILFILEILLSFYEDQTMLDVSLLVPNYDVGLSHLIALPLFLHYYR